MRLNPNMTTKEINRELMKGGQIEFTTGKYQIDDTLIIHSDTEITCHQDVYLYKQTEKPLIRTAVNKDTIKYKGVKNVTWNGGILIGNGVKKSSNIVEIIHATDIDFVGTIFMNCVNLHFVEIHASRNVHLIACTFSNHILTKEGKWHKEFIQIDYANYDGLGYAPRDSRTYDDTHCRNITIKGCTFRNANVCIGTHTATTSDNKHKTIKIIENEAVGVRYKDFETRFVRLINMSDVLIEGNSIEGFYHGIYIDKLKSGHNPHGGKETLLNYKLCDNVKAWRNRLVNIKCEFTSL